MQSGLMAKLALALALAVGIAAETSARIKLVTLPARERVTIQLEHPGATLVEEERVVPLSRGGNQVDFSWANTRIDPESIVLRVVGAAGERDPGASVRSVSYPPGEQALIWDVYARQAGAARVRITYLLENLERSFSYRALAAPDERTMELAHYLRVTNLANEPFGESSLRLGYGQRVVRPIGLDQTRRVLLERYTGVPVRKRYTADPGRYGYADRARDELRVAMHYVLANRAGAGLGRTPLEGGKVRIFQADGRGSSAFLGEDRGVYTPPGGEMSLYLGLARDIGVRRVVERSDREPVAGELFHQHVVVRYELQNFKSAPATVRLVEDLRRLREHLIGRRERALEWELGAETTLGGPDASRSSAERLVMEAALPAATDEAARTVVRRLHLVIRNEW